MGEIDDSTRHGADARAPRPARSRSRAQRADAVPGQGGARVHPGRGATGSAITQRTVERYLKGTLKQPPQGPRRPPGARGPPRLAAAGPRSGRRSRPPRPTGIVIETRARFGFTAAPGTTDDGRIRRITQHLPPAYAARLFDAQAAGATEQQLQQIAAEGLQEIYFKDSGRRADGLEVEFTDIDYIEFDF